MLSVAYSYKCRWNRWNYYAIISFTIIIGFRACGIDYFAYKDLFDYLINIDAGLTSKAYYMAQIYKQFPVHFEWAYLILIKLIKLFTTSSIPFFTSIAFVQIFCFDSIIRKYESRQRMFLVFTFFTTLIFVEVFNGMRQFAAYFLFLCLVPYIETRNWRKFFLFGALLYFVHSSTLFLLPLYFFIHKDFLKGKMSQLMIYFLVVLLSAVFIDQLKLILNWLFAFLDGSAYVRSQYLNVDEQIKGTSASMLVYIFRFSTIIFMVLNSKKFKEAYGAKGVILYNMTFIGYLLLELSFNMGVYRLNYYFYYNVFFVMGCMLFRCLCGSDKKPAYQKGYAVFLMALYVLWFVNSVIKGAGGCAPYVLAF